MKSEIIKSYLNSFESHAYKTDEIEFWFARDIQELLDYTNWRNFLGVIDKAKMACENAGVNMRDHFADTVRAVNMPNGGIKEVDDIFLTRYACYLLKRDAKLYGLDSIANEHTKNNYE